METRRRELGPRHPDTLSAANNAAYRLLKQGDAEAAERELAAISEIAEQVLGPSHATTIRIVENHAKALLDNRKFYEGEELLSRVLAARELDPGPQHASTLATMTACAELRQQLGWNGKALRLGVRALEGCLREFGPEDSRTVRARHLAASLQLSTGTMPMPLGTSRNNLKSSGIRTAASQSRSCTSSMCTRYRWPNRAKTTWRLRPSKRWRQCSSG